MLRHAIPNPPIARAPPTGAATTDPHDRRASLLRNSSVRLSLNGLYVLAGLIVAVVVGWTCPGFVEK